MQSRYRAHVMKCFVAIILFAASFAVAADPTTDVPVYADVLLDAIAADGDDQKVILYSAIAVEIMALSRVSSSSGGPALIASTGPRNASRKSAYTFRCTSTRWIEIQT